jgi:hypothetical protein
MPGSNERAIYGGKLLSAAIRERVGNTAEHVGKLFGVGTPLAGAVQGDQGKGPQEIFRTQKGQVHPYQADLPRSNHANIVPFLLDVCLGKIKNTQELIPKLFE